MIYIRPLFRFTFAEAIFIYMEEKVMLKTSLRFPVKSFKRFDNPYDPKESPTKYQFFVNTSDIPKELENWLEVNPREQNEKTDVARAIRDSLASNDKIFHQLNRGICLAADEVTYDNKTKEAIITLLSVEKHGIVDGGHTFKMILRHHEKNIPNIVEKYVQIEVVTDIDSIDTIAEARNTSIAVDEKSIQELKGSFNPIKSIIKDMIIGDDKFIDRIAFKQNEFCGKTVNSIDAREIIAIINMFNPYLYDPEDNNHPLQSYSGKEVSLKRFIYLSPDNSNNRKTDSKYRSAIIMQMSDIIPDIFKLWDMIELEFADASRELNRRYGSKPYSNYGKDNVKKVSVFSNKELRYTIPKGIMYPVVGAFRALVERGDNDKFTWNPSPFSVWTEKKEFFVSKVLDSSQGLGNSPDKIGKSVLLWDSLYNQVLIHKLMLRK
jgi:hypothetical protein